MTRFAGRVATSKWMPGEGVASVAYDVRPGGPDYHEAGGRVLPRRGKSSNTVVLQKLVLDATNAALDDIEIDSAITSG